MRTARLPAPVLAVLPLALIAGCDQPPASDGGAALDAIHEVEKAQISAFDSRDADGALAPYAEDSAFIASGTPYLAGLDAIRPAFRQMLDDPNAMLRMTPKGSFVSASGDLAVTTADYDYTYTDAKTGKPVTDHGVNQTVWQKQEDGSWKNMSDFNVSVLQPEAPAGGKADTAE